jgi:cytochrome b561
MVEHVHSYPTYAKFIHLGIAVFGITAYLTGDWADGDGTSLGYLMHTYLGLSLAAFMLVRIAVGLSGSQTLSFWGRSPFSRQQWRFSLADIKTLAKLGLPERDPHQGLAGITQTFGLIIFTWMGITGTGIFLLASGEESNVFEFIEEAHELGESLIPIYLVLHVGAVVIHTLGGNPIWKKMFMR